MSENSEILAQFAAITGADEDRAKFYLESSAWKLDVAISRYYENDGAEEDDDVQAIPDEQPPPPALPASAAEAAAAVPKRVPAPRSMNSNFATLNSLQASSDEDDEEEGQAFYAGGSEHSGQQVLGPSKKKDVVSGMFKSVQRHGVEVVEPKAGGSKMFKGTGYKLGQTTDDTVVIAGASAPAPPEVSLKLWREGFSVNDGELRSYTDPANAEFLQSIRHGEIPQELRQGNSEVYLSMEDRRMESFKQSEESRRPFQGQGHTLGSPAPPVVGATGEEDKAVNEARARADLNVNSSQPTTNIQIRLTDGTRLVGQFNHTHTVGNIRSYIVASRPQYETREFNLLSSYPSRILDDAETIADANLLNAAIMQKLI